MATLERIAPVDVGIGDKEAVAERGRRSLAVPGLIAGAWATLLVAEATGAAAALHHHALIEGGVPLAIAIPAFLLGWIVMIAAMMLPASLPAIGAVEAAAARLPRGRPARPVFLASFALVWMGFGLGAFLGDVGLHHLVDTSPWLAERPWLIEAGILALAGGYQLAPVKRRGLAACRHPTAPHLMPDAVLGDAARAGLRHGLACLTSSWALTLLMFGEGFASLGWMTALAILMGYETTGRHGQRAASAGGVVLILAAAVLAAGGVRAT